MKNRFDSIQGEQWAVVKTTARCTYRVSSLGRVRSSNKVLKNHVTRHGYHQVTMGGQHAYVHRLVAQAFIGDIPKSKQVNHIDGDKNNNCLSNLEIISPSENVQHAVKLGLVRRGTEHHWAKYSILQQAAIIALHNAGWLPTAIAKVLNVNRSSVSSIVGKLHAAKS